MGQQIHRASKKPLKIIERVINPSFFWKTLYIVNKHRKQQLQKVFNKWIHKLLKFIYSQPQGSVLTKSKLELIKLNIAKIFLLYLPKKCIWDNIFKESYLQDIFLFTYHQVEQHKPSWVPCHCLSCRLVSRLSSGSWSYTHSVFQLFFWSQHFCFF